MLTFTPKSMLIQLPSVRKRGELKICLDVSEIPAGTFKLKTNSEHFYSIKINVEKKPIVEENPNLYKYNLEDNIIPSREGK